MSLTKIERSTRLPIRPRGYRDDGHILCSIDARDESMDET